MTDYYKAGDKVYTVKSNCWTGDQPTPVPITLRKDDGSLDAANAARAGTLRQIDDAAGRLADGDAFMVVQDFDDYGTPLDRWSLYVRDFDGEDEVWTQLDLKSQGFVAAIKEAAALEEFKWGE